MEEPSRIFCYNEAVVTDSLYIIIKTQEKSHKHCIPQGQRLHYNRQYTCFSSMRRDKYSGYTYKYILANKHKSITCDIVSYL